MRYKFKLSHIPYILAYALAFAMIGALDVITGKISLWELNLADFIKNFLLLSAANWLAFLATAQLKSNKIVEYNRKLAEEETANKDLKIKSPWTQITGYLDTLLSKIRGDFSAWVVKKSLERKEKVWILRTKRKIIRLEKRATFKDKLVEAEGTPQQKENNRYCKRKRKLNDQISPEYLKRNLPYLKVKFKPVSENFLRLGVDDDNQHDPNIPERAFQKKMRDLWPKLLLNLSFAFLFATYTWEYNNMGPEDYFSIVVKTLFLAINIYSGAQYSIRFVKEFIMKNIQIRINLLTEYFKETKGEIPHGNTQ